MILSVARCGYRLMMDTCMRACLRDAGAPRNSGNSACRSPAARRRTARPRTSCTHRTRGRHPWSIGDAKRLPPGRLPRQLTSLGSAAQHALDARWARSSAPRRPTAPASRAPSPRLRRCPRCGKRYGSRKRRTRRNDGKAPVDYRSKRIVLLLPRTVWALRGYKSKRT